MSSSQRSSSPYTVFHGTTAPRAALIQDQGFQGPAIESELRRLADLHEVDYETLWDLLQAESILVGELNRESSVYFSADKAVAENYASRGPEYLYLGISFIHRLQHPGFDEEFPKWWHSDDLMWRLFRNQLSDPPVVLTVSFPEGSIQGLLQNGLSQRQVDALAAQSIYGPINIKMPLPITDARVTLVEKVPVRINPALASFVAGFPTPEHGGNDQFIREVDEGRFGPLVKGRSSFEAWFEWDDFKTRIPDERLAELMTPDGL